MPVSASSETIRYRYSAHARAQLLNRFANERLASAGRKSFRRRDVISAVRLGARRGSRRSKTISETNPEIGSDGDSGGPKLDRAPPEIRKRSPARGRDTVAIT